MEKIVEKTNSFQVGDTIQFVSYYMKLGDMQATTGKEGLIIKDGIVTKLIPGYICYKIEGETGERKCNIKFANSFRDFGTSIYGIFEPGKMEQKEYLETIIEKLEERVLEINTSKAFLLKELDKI